MKLLAFDLPLLRYANEAVLPFFILHQTVLLYVGYFVMTWEIHDAIKWVIVFAVAGASRSRSPMPLKYDPGQDIILNSESITDQSSIGVHVVNDEEASIGKAIEFSSGANAKAESEPKVYVEMRFSAPAGRYFVWLRGKTDINSGYTDSVWAQVDDQIGTRTRSVRLGNWLDVHPVGVYGWASDTDHPIAVVLKHSGDHTIRIQPRQIPHRIDQIWLSRFQHLIPNTLKPIK